MTLYEKIFYLLCRCCSWIGWIRIGVRVGVRIGGGVGGRWIGVLRIRRRRLVLVRVAVRNGAIRNFILSRSVLVRTQRFDRKGIRMLCLGNVMKLLAAVRTQVLNCWI